MRRYFLFTFKVILINSYGNFECENYLAVAITRARDAVGLRSSGNLPQYQPRYYA